MMMKTFVFLSCVSSAFATYNSGGTWKSHSRKLTTTRKKATYKSGGLFDWFKKGKNKKGKNKKATTAKRPSRTTTPPKKYNSAKLDCDDFSCSDIWRAKYYCPEDKVKSKMTQCAAECCKKDNLSILARWKCCRDGHLTGERCKTTQKSTRPSRTTTRPSRTTTRPSRTTTPRETFDCVNFSCRDIWRAKYYCPEDKVKSKTTQCAAECCKKDDLSKLARWKCCRDGHLTDEECNTGEECPKNENISGDLTVALDGKVVTIKGDLTGLPDSMTNVGIHVHTGTDCTNNGLKTEAEINTHIGGHQSSNSIDGWAWPQATTYTTNAAGDADVDVTAASYSLATADGKPEQPAVEDHCVVLHGLSTSNMSPRVAIGKIVQDGGSYSATIGAYPGPDSGLGSTPSGKLTVSVNGDSITLKGALTGLGKSLTNAGIHVHSGTDCTGGGESTSDGVNQVVGGHFLYKGDGYATTKYSSDADGKSTVDIGTPKGAYTLKAADETADVPAVENHCIVLHSNDNGARIGIGQIVCSTDSCKASMGPYPGPAKFGAVARGSSEGLTMFAVGNSIVLCATVLFVALF